MKKVIAFLVIVLLVVSCASTMDSTWKKEGYNAQYFEKMAIVVVHKNMEVRQEIEDRI